MARISETRSSSTTKLDEKQIPKSYDELRESIRLRAYEIYEQQGREDGHALEHWSQAEAELIPPNLRLELTPHGIKLVAA